MSMAINRVSTNTVAAMLFPLTKPNRVPKVGSGRSSSASTVNSQSSSRPQSAATSNSSDEIHGSFEYALAALSSVGTTSSTSVTQASPEDQSGVVPQAGSAYAQVEQQAGQALDFTA